jgi:hypothetical protein
VEIERSEEKRQEGLGDARGRGLGREGTQTLALRENAGEHGECRQLLVHDE